jgi:hypothetical protein
MNQQPIPPPIVNKPTNKWLPIVLAGAFLALVVVVMVIGLVFGRKDDEHVACCDIDNRNTPSGVVDRIESKLKDEYEIVMLTDDYKKNETIRKDNPGKNYLWETEVAPWWRLSDDNYYTYYENDGAKGFRIDFGDYSGERDTTEMSTFIQDRFIDNDLQKVKSIETFSYRPMVWYANSSVICSLDDQSILILSCGEIAKYEELQQTYKPFWLKDADPNSYATASQLKIKDSQKAGYKLATIGFGDLRGTGAMGQYYQSPDGEWHFVYGGHQLAGCEDFELDGQYYDLREIFAGEGCQGVLNGVSGKITP